MNRPEPVPISIDEAIAGLTFLSNRTPTTTSGAAKEAFARLSDYRDGAVFVGHWAGDSGWERHPVGDEIVMVLKGETTIFFSDGDHDRPGHLTAGEFVVVPEGTWHRFETPDGVQILSVTPQPTDHSADRPGFDQPVAHQQAVGPVGDDATFPTAQVDERALYLDWLRYLRGAVLQKIDGLTAVQARWRPDNALISLLGIVNHLTHVEWRWIDGGFLGAAVHRSEDEFHPGPELTVSDATAAYRDRAARTAEVVRTTPLTTPCALGEGVDLRWVLLHLINETARHAGHADATRELLDGVTGE